MHFAFKEKLVEIDRIPLAEITAITTIIDSDIGAELNENGASITECEHTILVATESGGYNSGRAYYLRTYTTSAFDEIIGNLRRSVRAARKQRDNHGILKRARLKVRKIYESAPSQGLIILLIALVFCFATICLPHSLQHTNSTLFTHTLHAKFQQIHPACFGYMV